MDKIKWSTFDYDGYSHEEGLCGDIGDMRFVTTYRDNLLCLFLAKMRIYLRFKLLNQI